MLKTSYLFFHNVTDTTLVVEGKKSLLNLVGRFDDPFFMLTILRSGLTK